MYVQLADLYRNNSFSVAFINSTVSSRVIAQDQSRSAPAPVLSFSSAISSFSFTSLSNSALSLCSSNACSIQSYYNSKLKYIIYYTLWCLHLPMECGACCKYSIHPHNRESQHFLLNTYCFEFKVLTFVNTKIKSAEITARATKMTTALMLPAIAPAASADSELWPLSSVNRSKLWLVDMSCSPRGQSGD